MKFSCFYILLTLGAALSGSTLAARADSSWPPLNAIEEHQSNPVQVGNATFTTGYYSWYVPAYSVPSLHYSKSVNIGSYEWWVIVGLGGAELIGPRTGSRQSPVLHPTTRQRTSARASTSLPAIEPLPGVSNTLSSLPEVTSLPTVPNLADLPSLPSPSP